MISTFATQLRNFYLQVRCEDFLLPQTISVAVTVQPLPDLFECSGTQAEWAGYIRVRALFSLNYCFVAASAVEFI